MDVQQFLAEFGHIANASSGVARLRELVLVLAIQGRLSPQSPGATAGELLERVREEKRQLIKSRVIRPPKPLPPIGRNDSPHLIPENWVWVRFGEIAQHNSGKTLDSVRNNGIYRDYITTSNLYWGRFDLGNVKQMLIREEELEKCTARKNDLLICEGGEAGRAAVWTSESEVCFQNHVHRARFFGGINPFFAYRFFEKLNVTGEINAYRKGIGISSLSSRALAMIPFPLPPLEEQARIVAKVDELMALCDVLHAQQQDRRRLQAVVRQSTLQAVVAVTSSRELQTASARVIENFERLLSAPEDVEELRTMILELAIQGLLTEQLVNDGDATELIHLLEKKRSTSKRGARKRLDIAADEFPFRLPLNWAWARLSDMGYFLGGGTPSKSNHEYWRGEIPWVSPKDMKSTCIDSSQDHISLQAVEETAVKLIPPGALLFVVRGMILAHSFPVGVARRQVTINQDMKALCPHLPAMSEFLLLLLLGSKRRLLAMIERSTHGTCRIATERIASYVVGIPPLNEQKRITARVQQLMGFCDALQSHLNGANALSGRLARSAISSLTGINVSQQDEPVKAPQIELIAPLRLGAAPNIKSQAPLATILARHRGEMGAKDLWQRFGGEIDAFYVQLRTEVVCGWLEEPGVAEVREKQIDKAGV